MSANVLPSPDYVAIKTKQQAAWATGNYAVIGSSVLMVPELLCESMDIRSGARVLDVAAGNGNASLAAARRWCQVTSTDYVPALLEIGKTRAAAEGYTITFETADAENLPYANESFDVALSTYGVMFAPNQERASAEMFRVVRPGGKIGLANWTPTGFVGQMFRVLSKYLPPAAGLKPPSVWGTETRLRELFPKATSIDTKTLNCTFRYISPEHWFETFSTYYGPMNRALAALDEASRTALISDVMALVAQLNRSGDGTLVLPSEYLEVVITK